MGNRDRQRKEPKKPKQPRPEEKSMSIAVYLAKPEAFRNRRRNGVEHLHPVLRPHAAEASH